MLNSFILLDCVENDNDDSIGSDTVIDKSFAVSTPKLSIETNFGCQRKKCCQLWESMQIEFTRKAF